MKVFSIKTLSFICRLSNDLKIHAFKSRINPLKSAMASVDPVAWDSLVQRLKSLKHFRLHTGNMNDYLQLKMRRYKTSAEELAACLDMQFAELKPDVNVK
uniref:Uncharacterized protein n=1 Tax=Panagrolaimus sp. JU765 TaxID=591449 RepID=A0AC34QGV6_9BILA